MRRAVSVRYDGAKPVELTSVVLAVQHDDLATEMFDGDVVREHSFIRSEVIDKIVRTSILREMSEDTRIVINGTGRFLLGGPMPMLA